MKAIHLALAAILLLAPHSAAGQTLTRSPSSDRCSGTIAAANVSQIASPGNNSRTWVIVQNPISATTPLFVDFGPNHLATPGLSFELAPGGSLSFLSNVVPNGQVNVRSATVGAAFICQVGR